MKHTCHAVRCATEVPPAMLMCRRHWAMVPSEIQRRVYATVGKRGPSVDASWAPWWLASHQAIGHVLRREFGDVAADKFIAKEQEFAAKLEAKGIRS